MAASLASRSRSAAATSRSMSITSCMVRIASSATWASTSMLRWSPPRLRAAEVAASCAPLEASRVIWRAASSSFSDSSAAAADIHLHRGLRRHRHQARDHHQHSVRDLHQPGFGGLAVLGDDGDQHGGADQVLAHLGHLAAEIGDGAAEVQHIGGVGRVAGADGILPQGLQLLLAAIQRDLPGRDLDLQPVEAAADGGGLLVQQLDGHRQVRLGACRAFACSASISSRNCLRLSAKPLKAVWASAAMPDQPAHQAAPGFGMRRPPPAGPRCAGS